MPYMGYYGIDMYYIVLVLPCVLFAFWAQSQVNSTFNRYSRVMSRRGLTGAQAAQAVLRSACLRSRSCARRSSGVILV